MKTLMTLAALLLAVTSSLLANSQNLRKVLFNEIHGASQVKTSKPSKFLSLNEEVVRLDVDDLEEFIWYYLVTDKKRKVVLTAIEHPLKPQITIIKWAGAYSIFLEPSSLPPNYQKLLTKCASPAKGKFLKDKTIGIAPASACISYHLDLYPPEDDEVVTTVVYRIMTELFAQREYSIIGFDYKH